MFKPLQLAAVAALQLPPEWYVSLNAEYTRRREKVFELMDLLGCAYDPAQVGLFVWARIPEIYRDGYELSDAVLYNAHVFITPGGIFGSQGDPYIRISLCSPVSAYETAIQRIQAKVLTPQPLNLPTRQPSNPSTQQPFNRSTSQP